MNPNLDTLATTVYVIVDDLLAENPHWTPERPKVGIAPRLSDAELVCLAVIQVLLRFTSEARFIRYAHTHLQPWFPYLPTRSAYNKRLRRSIPMMQHVMAYLARDSPSWNDDLWLVDSTPWNAAAAAPHSNARSWPEPRNTVTARLSPASSGE